MKLYNSTSDPDNHIASYKQMMFTAAIPHNLRESCICKGFEFSLVGPTLKLYTYLQNNSISFFTQLTNTFVEQFVSRKKFEKLSSNLYKVHQHRKELLSNYVFWFNYEKVSIPYCNQEKAVDTFWKGLLPDKELYKELTKFNCTTMEDVLAHAWIKIRWEEDEANHSKQFTYDNQHDDRCVRLFDRRANEWLTVPYPTSLRRGPF